MSRFIPRTSLEREASFQFKRSKAREYKTKLDQGQTLDGKAIESSDFDTGYNVEPLQSDSSDDLRPNVEKFGSDSSV